MRADYRCLSSAERRALRLGAAARGHALRTPPAQLQGRDLAASAGRGDRGRRSPPSRRCAGMSRLGSPMMRRGQGEILDEALDGIERALTGADERRGAMTRASAAADSKWWGWGDPATRRSSTRRRSATLRERIGELTPTPRAAALEDFSLPPAEPLPEALIDAVGPRRRLHLGRGPRPARHRLRLRRPRPAALGPARRRPRRGRSCPPTPTAVRRVLEVCAAEGVAVVPFGGGTSVVGGRRAGARRRTRA